MTTRSEATDAMMAHVLAALPTVPIMWPDTPNVVPENVAWARPKIQHVDGRQASLAGEVGQRKFERKGLLMVQCFSPVGDGYSGADILVSNLINSFEGIRNSPIWYRNIRAIEIGKEGSTMQINFIAEFQYEEIH